jgi:hypothetical protein
MCHKRKLPVRNASYDWKRYINETGDKCFKRSRVAYAGLFHQCPRKKCNKNDRRAFQSSYSGALLMLYGKYGAAISSALPRMNDDDIFQVYRYGRRGTDIREPVYWERAR